MRKVTPNTAVDNCKEVLEYYKEVFGGEVKNVQIAKEKRCSGDMRVKLSMKSCKLILTAYCS